MEWKEKKQIYGENYQEMNQAVYQKLSVANIMNGVTEGLSKFSKPTRVALIYAGQPDSPVRILDPQDLLRGHESKIRELFQSNNGDWRNRIHKDISLQPRGCLVPENNLALSGLISYGCSSNEFFYQMWFAEHHPDMCSIHPTERWLEQAATLLIHDYNMPRAAINSSEYVLKNYALQALSDYIVDEREQSLGFDSQVHISAVLNHILEISKAKEEGHWARGVLFFTDPHTIDDIEFITKIQRHERPLVSNIKHTRKLLVAVEESNRKLVSDGNTIIGITDGPLPDYAVVADFRGEYGFLNIGDNRVASFFDGSYHSTTREAKMVELEELLLDLEIGDEDSTILFQVVNHLVHSAGMARHGCTLVLDLNADPIRLSGHVLEPALSLLETQNLELARALLKIDGAVHLTTDSRMVGFGCLLDGKIIKWENMARGARYNSALRFSADNRKIIVVVVSADRPVSIIYNGIEVSAFSRWKPASQFTPESITLEQYFEGVHL
ncbi:MAG: DNA integrity scanning protein DisA nucleotide-binding domain protein [Desulfobacterales bacterium]|nr:DNA integrity scanning protein DisA nucleotide-binding domain protein [Desulfobacterales bacterium]